MLLSVIVPVYNVENYIKTCIESIALQDLDSTNYEILAINDGGSDGSLSMLESLVPDYPNLSIISQENQGLSGARNTGMNQAKGEFILFVDADDTILPNSLAQLTKISKEENLDILEFGAQGITETGTITYTASSQSPNNEVLDGENYLANIAYISSACNKLYKKSFLDTHQLRFMPRVYIEDIEFNTRAVFLAQRVLAIPTIYAYFLQREGSITRSSNYGKMKKMIYDIFTVLTAINTFTEHTVTKTSKAYLPLKKRVSSLVATMLLRACKETKELSIAKDVLKQLKEQHLYPSTYKAETKSKQIFMVFANQEWLFLGVTKLYCALNSRTNEK